MWATNYNTWTVAGHALSFLREARMKDVCQKQLVEFVRGRFFNSFSTVYFGAIPEMV